MTRRFIARTSILATIIVLMTQPLLSGGAVVFAAAGDSTRAAYLPQLLATSRVQPTDEIRALWVVRFTLNRLDDIDRMIDFAVAGHFQMLFVQVRGRGDAYYLSDLSPPPPGLEFPVTDFDPLAYLLERAHQNGIAVHAWMNMFYVWSNPDAKPGPDHVVTLHPDWLLADATGTRMGTRSPRWWQAGGLEGYYLSPTVPAVRSYLAGVVRELVARYPVDGVHLDYIRFPGAAFGFDPGERTDFMLQYGVDPARLSQDGTAIAGLLGEHVEAALDSVYVAARVAAVDSMVAAVRGVTGDLPLSAAVMYDPQRARIEKGQDWVSWVYRGDVDFVVPMLYAQGPRDVQRYVRSYHNMIGRERVLPGLAVYDGRQRYLSESVRLLREIPAIGACLFSYNALAEERFSLRLIEDAFFPQMESDE